MSETAGTYHAQAITPQQAEIIRLLGFHVGRGSAATKYRLLDELARAGFYMTEREFREEVAALRKQGIMIGSSAGSNPGYYLIANMGEFDEFTATELLSRIKDLNDTYRAMSGAAQTQDTNMEDDDEWTAGTYHAQAITPQQAEIIRLLHVGRERAVTKYRLLDELARAGFYMTEREFREEVAALRKQGIMIGSSAGSNPGYYLIANMGEFDEFVNAELLSRIKDLQETYRALNASAQKEFGGQLSFFGGRS